LRCEFNKFTIRSRYGLRMLEMSPSAKFIALGSLSMATVEAALACLGLCYAPDDSTLPHSRKGLIDGSTGLLYYWNLEFNVTQYENHFGC
ncbi:hypothetical protein HAX54_011122, partial [Datura stramonium]|nr:hypothetical protein [Datura stramonium]